MENISLKLERNFLNASIKYKLLPDVYYIDFLQNISKKKFYQLKSYLSQNDKLDIIFTKFNYFVDK